MQLSKWAPQPASEASVVRVERGIGSANRMPVRTVDGLHHQDKEARTRGG